MIFLILFSTFYFVMVPNKLPRLALNSFNSPGKPQTQYPPASASQLGFQPSATRLSLFVFVAWGKVFIAHTILEPVGGGGGPGDRDSDMSLGCLLGTVCVLSLCQGIFKAQNSDSE